MSRFIFSFLLSYLVMIQYCTGQDSIQQKTIEEVKITGNWAQDRSPVTKKTIYKRELNTDNALDIPVLLSGQASAVSSSDAGNGTGYTYLRIRGSDQTRLNVTIDGVPVNDAESQNVFWVDLPDMMEDAQAVQIQRGVGLSAAGPGAFGANINLQTGLPATRFGVQANLGAGSFNTQKVNLGINSGILGDKFRFKVRGSRITSDGYIDRASSELWAASFQSHLQLNDLSVQGNVYWGKQRTYQAWYGVPYHYYFGDDASKKTYNPAGEKADGSFFDDETDNYQQVYSRIIIKRPVNDHSVLSATVYHTYGSGYYNQYRPGEDLDDYFPLLPAGPHDLIRERWLDNHLLGLNAHWNLTTGNMAHLIGANVQAYHGAHFGVVSDISGINDWNEREYYRNKAHKTEQSIYYKNELNYQKLSLLVDLQLRNLSYTLEGYQQDGTKGDIVNKELFFNPKAGISYYPQEQIKIYGFAGLGHKEPNRDDYVDAPYDQRPLPEKMFNTEAGIVFNNEKWMVMLNYFLMLYKDQLVVSGEINDVGAYTRINAPRSYRTGIELDLNYRPVPLITLQGNLALSKNKIRAIDEYIDASDIVNGEYVYLPQIVKAHENTDISFSPEFISFGELIVKPLINSGILLAGMELAYNVKYISSQYMDNFENNYAQLPAFTRHGLRLSAPFEIGRNKLTLSAMVNNLFNNTIIPNGWVYRYFYGGPASDITSPYDRIEGQGYYTQAGLFPEAGRNFFINLKYEF